MIGIVVVSYRSDDATVDFVRGELCKISSPYKIVVVANGSSAEEAAALAARIPEADVLAAPNRGYAAGNNLGFKYLMENYSPDYVLFSNNDIHFISNNVVEILSETLSSRPEAGLAGPEVLGLDGKRQGPDAYLGIWDRYVWMYLSSPFLSEKAKRARFKLDVPACAQEGPCYKLSGSFFMVDAKAFSDAGMFDENTFLYAEENILSDRMARIGKTCWFNPAVSVLHEHGKTISKAHDAAERAWMQWKSMRYYYRTYRGVSLFGSALAGLIFRCILSFGNNNS